MQVPDSLQPGFDLRTDAELGGEAYSEGVRQLARKHCIVHCIVHYTVHYTVHDIVHYTVHYTGAAARVEACAPRLRLPGGGALGKLHYRLEREPGMHMHTPCICRAHAMHMPCTRPCTCKLHCRLERESGVLTPLTPPLSNLTYRLPPSITLTHPPPLFTHTHTHTNTHTHTSTGLPGTDGRGVGRAATLVPRRWLRANAGKLRGGRPWQIT